MQNRIVVSDAQDLSRVETLRNGLVVRIRSLRADDRERIADAIGRLDLESLYLRFFGYKSELTEAGLDRIMSVDPNTEVALLMTIENRADEIVIGSGRYFSCPTNGGQRTAEVAFIVRKEYQGLGVAGRLLSHLAEIAKARGITAFQADVLAQNKSMLSVLAGSGLPMQQQSERGVVRVTISLTPT